MDQYISSLDQSLEFQRERTVSMPLIISRKMLSETRCTSHSLNKINELVSRTLFQKNSQYKM